MIVLDTHIWLWWVNNDNQNLKPEWMSRIQSSEEVGVSAISCFEVAWLERHNRIALPCPRQEWLEKTLAGSSISLLPISPIVASIAVDLPEHHRDPQDRIIIATALAYEGTLISADGKFPLYSELTDRLLT